MLGLSYQSFTPLLIKKVQDQQKEINELKEEKQIISTKLEEIKSNINNTSSQVPISDTKTTPLLYSDSISALKQEVFTDGLSREIDESNLLLHLVNSMNYLVSELDRVKYLVNHL